MLKDRIVYSNGSFISWDQATVHIMSHSFARGSAIFEVLSLHDTPGGPAVFRIDEHINRFFRSVDRLEMDLSVTHEEIHEAVMNTIRRNEINTGYIKIVGYYPQVAFHILPPRKRLDISIFVIDSAEDIGDTDFPFEQGTTLCISTWYKLDPRTVPPEVKSVANYLNGMLARTEAQKRGFEFSVMLDTQGFVAEGSTESVLLVKNNRLMTPCLGTILGSITRQSVLEIAATLGIYITEGRISQQMFLTADEVFLSGTVTKVLPVRKIEDRIIEGTPGPVTQQLSKAMTDIFTHRESDFNHWLFPVK